MFPQGVFPILPIFLVWKLKLGEVRSVNKNLPRVRTRLGSKALVMESTQVRGLGLESCEGFSRMP